ncbi:hypothetical protein JT359_08430 [Candidatus Poribacteria bacterium]|nr:hypothetical protein [Candidatus Poribacteria bacterium]
MKKIVVLLLMTSLMLIALSIGYTQEADIEMLPASDVNADGIVNILDLTLVAKHFGETPTEDQHPSPDINGDDIVNILDLTLVASHFGKKSGVPFEVTDATFNDIVLGSEIPIVVEFKSDL